MDELLEQFVNEGRELVQLAFDDLFALERHGPDAGRLDGLFRAIHTLKGSAGLFDMAPMGTALHAAEDLLERLRGGMQAIGPEQSAALMDCLGATERWIEAVASTGHLPGEAAREAPRLVAALHAAAGGAAAAAAPPVADDAGWLAALARLDPGGQGQTALRYVPAADCFFVGDDPLALVREVPELMALLLEPLEPWPRDAYDPFRCNLVISALSAAPVADVRAVFRLVQDQVTIVAVGAGPAPAGGPRMLRIDARRIEGLADLVGEVFVAKNRLAHLAAEAVAVAPGLARRLAATQADLEHLVGELHRGVMAMRMVPLDASFRRLPRLVRETAAALGKSVHLAIEGGETLADRGTVDALSEPLLHVLRNALDHGIEAPEQRAARGKPREGRIALRAGLEAGRIVIEVADDGGGIAPDELRRVARARGMAFADELDDAGVLDLVFLPGFSTRRAVTETSGRGVGMDAVRAALLAIGGEVSLDSSPGRGTTVRLVVAQTAAVTEVVLVTSGAEQFGVAIGAVIETVRVPRAAVRPVQGGRAFVLRDRTVPLLDLAALLGRATAAAAGVARVLVVESGGHPVGVEVDGFGLRLGLVVRPLDGLLAGTPGVRGSALLGDGRVLLVLDLPELIGREPIG